MSSNFLGVPSGFVESHLISPLKEVIFDIKSARSFIDKSFPVPTFRKLDENSSEFISGSHFSKTNLHAFPKSWTCKNSLNGLPLPQQVI